MPEPYDLIVIGAGWFGLSSAQAYHTLHPQDKILILESSSTCGGTWSQDRLYPGLKSNNVLGSYEHPDFPMREEIYGVKHHEHIPAATLHQYLTDFAKKFGIFEHTRCDNKVESVEPSSVGWKLCVTAMEGTEEIETKKLIVATGLTSTPNLPSYPGQATFKPPLFHAKDFCINGSIVNTAKRAVVIGGAKSAFDIAYAFASNDVEVDMIIRDKGQGPVWLCPRYVTPLKRLTEELLHTRLLTWFSPCPWGNEDGFPNIRKFLHGTWLGRSIVKGFWWVMSNDVITLNGYEKNELVGQLKPWNSVLWSGSGVSIHNYDENFFDFVKEGKIKIHTTDISRLSDTIVYLENGTELETDVVVAATGWKKDTTFKFQNLRSAGLGLPHTPEEKAVLNQKADQDILTLFPLLKEQPILKSTPPESDPLRLYRFMVPPTMMAQRNIAFAGLISSVSTSITAAVQGLWISAFFDNALDRIPSVMDEITEEVMLHTQWGKWRYPCGYGARIPDFAFDALGYVDLMLRDLGLRNHRKYGWVDEVLMPYKPRHYRGLIEEWEAAHEAALKKGK